MSNRNRSNDVFNAFKKALQRLQISADLKETPQAFDHVEASLHLQGVDSIESHGMKWRPETTTIIYDHVRIETEPTIPFFMLSLPTFVFKVEQEMQHGESS